MPSELGVQPDRIHYLYHVPEQHDRTTSMQKPTVESHSRADSESLIEARLISHISRGKTSGFEQKRKSPGYFEVDHRVERKVRENLKGSKLRPCESYRTTSIERAEYDVLQVAIL